MLVTAGRLLGMQALYVFGAGGGALVALAAWSIRFPRPRIEVHRELHPPRVYAGTESRVDVVVRNTGTRRTPVLNLRDPFDQGRRQARFLVAPLEPAETARAAYRLPTERRGVFSVGPLEAGVTEPYGLASRTSVVAPSSELTVYPRVDAIAGLPHARGDDPLAGAEHPTAVALSGEDFYALRAYEVGDDLRRVHWPSTARLDELMIRQNEMPWQARVTVLVDVRRRVHRGESLELAVSAAASVVAACWQRRSLVRLVTSDAVDSGFGAGHVHLDAIMEKLATVTASPANRLTDVLGSLSRAGNAGSLVAILTAEAAGAELERVARLRWRFGSVTVVLFERSAYEPTMIGAEARRMPPHAGALVRVDHPGSFATAWNRIMANRVLASGRS
jgi:uncharacterized protein (DUF58 family)